LHRLAFVRTRERWLDRGLLRIEQRRTLRKLQDQRKNIVVTGLRENTQPGDIKYHGYHQVTTFTSVLKAGFHYIRVRA